MIDINSPTWRTVSLAARTSIEDTRTRLEHGNGRSDDFERGYLAALRDVIALATPVSRPVVTAESYEA